MSYKLCGGKSFFLHDRCLSFSSSLDYLIYSMVYGVMKPIRPSGAWFCALFDVDLGGGNGGRDWGCSCVHMSPRRYEPRHQTIKSPTSYVIGNKTPSAAIYSRPDSLNKTEANMSPSRNHDIERVYCCWWITLYTLSYLWPVSWSRSRIWTYRGCTLWAGTHNYGAKVLSRRW